MKDYRIDIAVKNNRILSRIKDAGYESVSDFCRACGLQNKVVGLFINMKKSPLSTQTGTWRKAVEVMALALSCCPEDLFNEQQAGSPLATNRRQREINADQLFALMHKPETDLLKLTLDDQAAKATLASLEYLTDSEKNVIELRFGLNGNDEHTLEEIAEIKCLSRQRIRDIESQALRKLRHRGSGLRSFVSEDNYRYA